jgi:hypothetical protein
MSASHVAAGWVAAAPLTAMANDGGTTKSSPVTGWMDTGAGMMSLIEITVSSPQAA